MYPGTAGRELRMQQTDRLKWGGAFCEICGAWCLYPDFTGFYVTCCPGIAAPMFLPFCWEVAEFLEIWSKVRDLDPVSYKDYLRMSLGM